MFSNFLRKNSSTLLIIGALVFLLILVRVLNRDQTRNLLSDPQVGQIYIFHEDNVYAPMRLDSIGNQQLYMRNYLYIFADAVPKKEQIIAEELDLQIMAIYEQEELDRLYAEGILVKIYGP